MKLNYIKINHNLFKFFYDGYGRYGEFYIKFDKVDEASGFCELTHKDIEYASDLMAGLSEELLGLPNGFIDEEKNETTTKSR